MVSTRDASCTYNRKLSLRPNQGHANFVDLLVESLESDDYNVQVKRSDILCDDTRSQNKQLELADKDSESDEDWTDDSDDDYLALPIVISDIIVAKQARPTGEEPQANPEDPVVGHSCEESWDEVTLGDADRWMCRIKATRVLRNNVQSAATPATNTGISRPSPTLQIPGTSSESKGEGEIHATGDCLLLKIV